MANIFNGFLSQILTLGVLWAHSMPSCDINTEMPLAIGACVCAEWSALPLLCISFLLKERWQESQISGKKKKKCKVCYMYICSFVFLVNRILTLFLIQFQWNIQECLLARSSRFFYDNRHDLSCIRDFGAKNSKILRKYNKNSQEIYSVLKTFYPCPTRCGVDILVVTLLWFRPSVCPSIK